MLPDCSVLETSRPALHPILHQVGPDKLDHPGVVVTVGEVVIQGGEAMLLAGLLHAGQLFCVKLVAINVSPIVGGGIHGETRSHRAVGADDDVVLASPTIPFGKMQLTI